MSRGFAASSVSWSAPSFAATPGSKFSTTMSAFAASACELLLGADAADETATSIADRVYQAGAPLEAAAIIGRIRAGSSMTSEDLAEKLGPFADYSGPSTEPLLPIVPARD